MKIYDDFIKEFRILFNIFFSVSTFTLRDISFAKFWDYLMLYKILTTNYKILTAMLSSVDRRNKEMWTLKMIYKKGCFLVIVNKAKTFFYLQKIKWHRSKAADGNVCTQKDLPVNKRSSSIICLHQLFAKLPESLKLFGRSGGADG